MNPSTALLAIFNFTAQILFGHDNNNQAPGAVGVRSQAGTRIVGGEDIGIDDAPYQISLMYRRMHVCGGCIISQVHVITAAHCVHNRHTSVFQIRAGSSYRSSGGQVVGVRNIHEHPNYNGIFVDNDIAILMLASPLVFGSSINSIPLASEYTSWYVGYPVFVSGWGLMSEDAKVGSETLKGVVLQILHPSACWSVYGKNRITATMLCVGTIEGDTDSCQGDSGGPMLAGSVLGGIVSWGNGCARTGVPGVYTSIPAVRNFIRQVTGI